MSKTLPKDENKHTQKNNSWECKNKSNTLTLARWTAAWLITLALATFSPQFSWGESKILTLLAILLNLLVGIGMIIANKNHLKNLDELQQKIMFEAMAITLGVGLVTGLSYSLLDITNIIPFDAEISNMYFIMGFTYIISIAVIKRRYQ